MESVAWLCLCCLASSAIDSPTAAENGRSGYEARRQKVGADAKSHIDLALWCEEHGLSAERTKHLALAVLKEPNNAVARGLLGLIAFRGRWENPDALRAKIAADEKLTKTLAEYNRLREALQAHERPEVLESAQNAEKMGRAELAERRRRWYASKMVPEHVKLGLWCEKNGLKAEATAHFTQAAVLDPYREATWKHLGYVKHDGQWMSHENAASARAEEEATRRADRHWEPLLRKWKALLKHEGRAEEARASLAEVADPRAVSSVMKVFAGGDQADQEIALGLLAQIDTPTSTRRLAQLSVFSRYAAVRNGAAKILGRREPRDYAGDLIDLIRAKMTYQVQPVQGPGSPGALLVETPRFKVLRTYDAPPAFHFTSSFYGYAGYDANGLPVVARGRELTKMERESSIQRAGDVAAIEMRTAQLLSEANLKAVVSQQRLAADVDAIETGNMEAAETNPRIVQVLKDALQAPDELKDDDEGGWHAWWFDKLGYRYDSPTQVTLQVNASPQWPPPRVYSCFAAGTPVRTLDGHKPIETLGVGDQVLAQDVATGALGFHPVTVVHHNAPSATIVVRLDNGETLTASIYHRFWRAGLGWAMARELKPGDSLRMLSGVAKVESAGPGPTVPVYNLDVAEAHTFFVGTHDSLVHDNTLPSAHLKPFDRRD